MRKYFVFLFLCSFFIGSCYSSGEGGALRCRIYFPVGGSALELSFRNNGARLDSLLVGIRSLRAEGTIRRISLTSSSSPEGNSISNGILSEKRGASLCAYIQRHLSLPDSVFELSSLGQDWEGLSSLVEASDMPYREDVMAVLRDISERITEGGTAVDSRKRRLMRLGGGSAWRYMRERFFPELRNSSVVECEFDPIVPEETCGEDLTEVRPMDTIASMDTVDIPCDTLNIPSTVVAKAPRPFHMALKTNLLYDALLVPNIGLEFYLGKGWSVGGNWMYAWWKNDRRHHYWRVYGGEIEVRKYWGCRAAANPLTGHHIGVYGQALTYDFERGGRGYIGGRPGGTLWEKANYGVGVGYGYSLPISKRLNLDFSLGIGYLGGIYYEYDPMDGHYVWKETRQRHWLGPTKAEVTLVWFLGDRGGKKGGELK